MAAAMLIHNAHLQNVAAYLYLTAVLLTDFIWMPNIRAGRQLVPELIQRDIKVEKLVGAAEPLLSDSIRADSLTALKALRERLGSPGAAARVAMIALEMIALELIASRTNA